MNHTSNTGGFWRAIRAPLAAAVLLRVALLLFGEGDPGDGVNRTLTAYSWLTTDYRLFGAHTWPELNYLFPAAAIRVTGELYWGTRILFALVSLGVVPLAYAIASGLTDRRAARSVAWIAALLPYAAVLGTDGARGEVAFVVGALFAAYFAQRWIADGLQPRDAVLAALGVIWAEGFRFDGVVVGAGVGAAMTLAALLRVTRDGDRGATGRAVLGLALFAVLSLVYPLALGFEWHARYDDALYYMHTAATNSGQFLVGGEHARWSPAFYRTYSGLFPFLGAAYLLTPVFALLAVVGIVKTWRRPVAWPLLAALLAYTLFFVRGTITMLVQPQLRYAAVPGLLALPFVAAGVVALSSASGRSRFRLSPSLLLGTGVVVAVLVQCVTTLATVRPMGILSRQLSGTGLMPPVRFAARDLLPMLPPPRENGKLIITGFVPGSYVYLASDFRRTGYDVEYASVYRTNTLVMTRDEFERTTAERLTPGTLVMVETGGRMQGFTDGLSVDPIGSAVPSQNARVVWRGIDLEVLGRSQNLALLSVVSAAPR